MVGNVTINQDPIVKIGAHALVGCASAAADGGECAAGGAGAAAAKGITLGASGLGIKSAEGQYVVAAVAGGTASQLAGGRFANGALTAAFGYLFNYCEHNDCWGSMGIQGSTETTGYVIGGMSADHNVIAATNVLTVGLVAAPLVFEAGATWITAEVMAPAAARSELFGSLFGKSVGLNTGQGFRIGLGRDGGETVFRAAGDYLGKVPQALRDVTGIRLTREGWKVDLIRSGRQVGQ